jgi:hypothetical protein
MLAASSKVHLLCRRPGKRGLAVSGYPVRATGAATVPKVRLRSSWLELRASGAFYFAATIAIGPVRDSSSPS